jgi:DNA repair exonuclease SbcCD nuclease subunit
MAIKLSIPELKRIAFLSDFHLGYPRFKEDAYKQAKEAMKKANELADIIVVGGDIFDRANPTLETLREGFEIFNAVDKPCIITHGNHERRAKAFANAVELLGELKHVYYLHGETAIINDRISITVVGSVPDDLAMVGIKQVVEKEKENLRETSFLVIHQSIAEFCLDPNNSLTVDDLLTLPFTFIVCGHLHRNGKECKGRIIFPGSTVVTQLKQEETSKRGFFVYDVSNGWDFIEISSRPFFVRTIEFNEGSFEDVQKRVESVVEELRKEQPNAVIKVILKGSLQKGLSPSDISLPKIKDVYVTNNLYGASLIERIEMIKKSHTTPSSLEQRIVSLLKEKVELEVFNVEELFKMLEEGNVDEIEI